MIFERFVLYLLNMNDVVTTQAYNIQAVSDVSTMYNKLLITVLYHQIGSILRLSWHAWDTQIKI